ncbi:plasmid mobilization protein [Nitrosomonas ureae]|uniref:Mobilisation protein (MobC) n=1 Tax=Nitrosomonas ureae TaxID=44577 RepID=A0A286A4T8_9PROT|nr:plasmid mobilization relaxosome protein MobC [Nitrosomonas ureae]SOD16880.1 mobilisation protein (MobC) [Nitrosomonas ureae]
MASLKDKFNGRKPLPPFSIRLTKEERQKLDQLAQGTSLAEYIRSRIFDGSAPVHRTKGRFPVKDEQALSQILGMLGQSRIPNNINQLAKAANSGTLPVTPDTEKQLHEACYSVTWIRRQLIQALGLKAD